MTENAKAVCLVKTDLAYSYQIDLDVRCVDMNF